MSIAAKAKSKEEHCQIYLPCDKVTPMSSTGRNVDYIPVPLELQEWANGREIQSILFKVKVQSGIERIQREVDSDGSLILGVYGNVGAEIDLARMLLSVHLQEQSKCQEQVRRLQELEDCLHAAQAETVTGRCITIPVNKKFLGNIIGKKGSNINEIMKLTGTTIVVDSETCRASISGPSAQAVQGAKELLDYVEEKILLPSPLLLPPPYAQRLTAFVFYVTHDIRQASGCCAARVSTSALPPPPRGRKGTAAGGEAAHEEEEVDEKSLGDHVTFAGPRRAVGEAVSMLTDRLQELVEASERSEREQANAVAAEAADKLRAEQEKAELAARNIEVDVPKEFLGFIIGKKGSNINDITTKTGANITVHSDIARVSISGPTVESVQRARALIDFVEEKVPLSSPLPLPPPYKQSIRALTNYVTTELKHSTGCVGAKMATTAVTTVPRKTHSEDYVSFTGPRECVREAVKYLLERLQELAEEKEQLEKSEKAAVQAKQAANARAKECALAEATAFGKFLVMDLRRDLLGAIIGKRKSHIIEIMNDTGTSITVDSGTSRATITGPTAEAVQQAKSRLDFTKEKVPLPIPLPGKVPMRALCLFVTGEIKPLTGCVGANVVTSVISGPRSDGDEDGEYATFTGPRQSVAKAVILFEERLKEMELAAREVDGALYPPLLGMSRPVVDATPTDQPKTWADIIATSALQRKEQVRQDEDEDDSVDSTDAGWVRRGDQHQSTRRRDANSEGPSDKEDDGDQDYDSFDEEYSDDDEYIPGIPEYPLPLDIRCATVEINKIIMGLLNRVSSSISPQEEGPSYPPYVAGVEQTRKAIALGHAGIIFIAPNEESDSNISLMVSEAMTSATPVLYALNPSLLGESIRSGRTHNVVTVCKMEPPVGLYNVLCRYCR